MRSLVKYVLPASITAAMFNIAAHADGTDGPEGSSAHQMIGFSAAASAASFAMPCPIQGPADNGTSGFPGCRRPGDSEISAPGKLERLSLDEYLSAKSSYSLSDISWMANSARFGGELLKNELACRHTPPEAFEGSAVSGGLSLSATTALVIDQRQWQPLYAKAPTTIRPIASITKLMTAMIVLDAKLPLHEPIQIQRLDVDRLKGSSSRLRVGMRLTRTELLRLTLMASENRAAAALARTYPGGHRAFVAAMNRRARELSMHDSHFVDPTGLSPANVATAFDLATMVNAAYQYPLIREATTAREQRLALSRGRRMRMLTFHNSNRLVSSEDWDIGLSKTGYIREAGRCLVMQSMIGSKPVIIVLLDSMKKATRVADANYIRNWLSGAAFGRGAPRASSAWSVE